MTNNVKPSQDQELATPVANSPSNKPAAYHSSLSSSDSARNWPGITRTPGVCGGDPCIERTRIPVWILHSARLQGAPDEELLERYPGVTQRDLDNAWAYIDSHLDEVEHMRRENEDW